MQPLSGEQLRDGGNPTQKARYRPVVDGGILPDFIQ
jgi:hypothetical protein